MALATTCPHCKTSFKVVADQLKLRRGLVRCGKCQEVFSGVDYLRYIDDPSPRTVLAGTPGPKVFAQPDQGKPALGSEAEPSQAAPREASLDDLKTAFFLPETVFNASVMVDPVTIQAPVPVYMPSPTVAPSSRYTPAPETTVPADITPPPARLADAKPDSRDQDATTRTGRASDAREHESPARSELRATEHPASADSRTDDPPDLHGPRGADTTRPVVALNLNAPQASPSETEDEAHSGRTAPDLPDQTLADQASTGVEMAALKLSRLPDGVDLARSLQRPAKPVNPLHIEEAPANGAHFASGLDDDDHLAADARSAKSDEQASDQAIDFGAVPRKSASRLWPALAAGLLILAMLQGLVVMRNEITVQLPELKPVLANLVEPLGLKLELPRRYDAVTIESFELQATEVAAGDVQSYFAQALLRNHAGYPVQWPAIELSLTDPNGQLLARKVLLAADYLGTPELREQGFAGKSERTVRVRLGLNQITPNGYSAVLFYP